jgi:hypothetical protein
MQLHIFSLALQPQFGPWPTSLKLSGSYVYNMEFGWNGYVVLELYLWMDMTKQINLDLFKDA